LLIEDQGSAFASPAHESAQSSGSRRLCEPTPAGADVLDRLGALLDELGDLPVRTLANMNSIGSLAKAFARLDGMYARAAGAFRDLGDWTDSGALSAGAWLATEARLPIGEARRRVSVGATLRELPATSAAWVSGDINSSHVSRLAGVYRRATAFAMERDEKVLIDKAKTLKYESFSKVVAYWEGLADADGAESSAQAKRDRRDVYLVRSINEMYLGRMTLDPISGTIVATELERLERILFETDWARAKEQLGRDPLVTELGRTAAQRRADALVEMATRSGIAPADGVRPAPLFTVLVGYETLHGRICELAGGSVLSPGSLLPWMDKAYIERAVFSLKNRLEVSHRARLFTGATRRAIEIRDREGCTHPYCYAPAWRCQADHIQPYSEDGPTTQENGRLACGTHNRARRSKADPPLWRRPHSSSEGPDDA